MTDMTNTTDTTTVTDMAQWRESIDAIRLEIDDALAEADSRVAIAERARSFNPEVSDEQMAPLLDELERFVRGTPDLVELAGIEAETHGVLAEMQPLLDASVSYFFEDDDVIPDHLGLYGMLDDAYLVQKFLLSASEAHEEEHGIALLGEGLRPAVGVIRQWIGDEAADILDNKVAADLQQFNWKGALVVGALGVGALWLLGKVLNGSTDPTGGYGAWGHSTEAEIARMGAGMGMSLPSW